MNNSQFTNIFFNNRHCCISLLKYKILMTKKKLNINNIHYNTSRTRYSWL